VKVKTMLYAALGALTFKAGKVVAKKKTQEAVQDWKTDHNADDTSRDAT
jgi:hypothetical protein